MEHRLYHLFPVRRCSVGLFHSADPERGELLPLVADGQTAGVGETAAAGFPVGEIDPNRVYFFGISEGAYGSQRLASFYADYLAAAGPIAGGEPMENAPAENCANIAFSFRTGSNDKGFCRNELTEAAKTNSTVYRDCTPDITNTTFR